jgi:hypothetical protein
VHCSDRSTSAQGDDRHCRGVCSSVGSAHDCRYCARERRGAAIDAVHALREAKFTLPTAVSMDESDPVAGPQLIICDYGNHCIRSLNMRTEQVTTIAGGIRGYWDGPAVAAQFQHPNRLAVVPSTGVIFVVEQVRHRPLPLARSLPSC